jgi:hypothetical protein
MEAKIDVVTMNEKSKRRITELLYPDEWREFTERRNNYVQ